VYDIARSMLLLPWRPLINYCERNPRKWYIKQIPNFITIVRLILIYPLYLLFIDGIQTRSLVIVIGALLVGIFIGSSDAADGEISKKINYSIVFGKVVDPIADKAFFFIPAVGLFNLTVDKLSGINIYNLVFGVLLMIIEVSLFLTGLGGLIISRYRNIKLGSNTYGKMKFTSECFLLLGMVSGVIIWRFANLNVVLPYLQFYMVIMLTISVFFAILSLAVHIIDFFQAN